MNFRKCTNCDKYAIINCSLCHEFVCEECYQRHGIYFCTSCGNKECKIWRAMYDNMCTYCWHYKNMNLLH